MIGDVHATSAGGSVPLPPAFSQPPVQRPDAEDNRLRPPFFPSAPGAAAPTPAPADAAPAPIGFTTPASITSRVPPADPHRAPGFGGLPSDAIFLPEAPIPKKEKPAEEDDDGAATLADPRRRPISASDLAILVAARLELMARRLRERGSAGLTDAFSGDSLDLALAGLISGYMAGRGG